MCVCPVTACTAGTRVFPSVAAAVAWSVVGHASLKSGFILHVRGWELFVFRAFRVNWWWSRFPRCVKCFDLIHDCGWGTLSVPAPNNICDFLMLTLPVKYRGTYVFLANWFSSS